MHTGRIHMGTSGWSYKEWRGSFYPKGLKTGEWLSFYAKKFDCTEINTSFYHLPRLQTIEGWDQKVPDHFCFCPKMSQYVTHIKKLVEPEEPVQRFFEVFDHIKHKVGPVLIQLPPSLAFDAGRARHFFELLRNQYGEYVFALEVRHRSWLAAESIDLLKEYGITFVISQSGVGFPYEELITAQHIYIRFHGPEKLYTSSYSEEMLQSYAAKIKIWLAAGHDIWVFFNNTWGGAALENINRLRELLDAWKD
ncbi:DUF72 domain-containing protein [Chitinophagaceae bacterium MMS25-I14]